MYDLGVQGIGHEVLRLPEPCKRVACLPFMDMVRRVMQKMQVHHGPFNSVGE